MQTKTYDHQTAKFLAVVGENMPDIPIDVMQGWIENPRGLRKVLESALCPPSEVRVWRTIKLGTGPKTADDLRHALRDGNLRLSDRTSDILGKPAFTVATEETEVDLIKVSVAELGFEQGARREKIYERAKNLDLELCPAEVGPQLRLQHKDQPNGEWLLIGMEPIIDSGGYPHVFHVERYDSERWLYSGYGNPDYFWVAGNQWVFVSPRK